MKRNVLLMFAFAMVSLFSFAQKANIITVSSPTKKVVIQIVIDDNRLFFTVKKNNQEVIQKSSLGLVIDGNDIGQNVSITGKAKESIIKEKYPLMGNHA